MFSMFSGSQAYEKIFEFPHNMMKILGFMRMDEGNADWLKKAHKIYQIWTHLFYVFFMFSTLSNMYKMTGDILQSTTTLTGALASVGIYSKALIIHLQERRIRRLQWRLNYRLSTEIHDRDHAIYEKAGKEMRLYFRLIYSMISLLLCLWVASGVVTSAGYEVKVSPLPLYIFWDIQSTPVYVLTCIYETYGAFLVGLNGVTINLIIFGSVAQVCTEYEIIEQNVLMIREKFIDHDPNELKLLTRKNNAAAKDLLISSIIHHQKIIGCVTELESFYIHIFLFQFILTGSLGAVLFIQMIMVGKTVNSQSLVPGIFFSLLCVDIFLFCWFGTRLKNKSFDFFNAVYATPWTLMDDSNKKLVGIMLLKSQRSPKLTIEKLSDLDFVSFLELAKIVYNIVYLVIQLSSTHKIDLKHV